MATHVRATLELLLPRFQGLTVTETGVEDFLDTLLEGLVDSQLAHSESWGKEDEARRLSVEVLARVVVGQTRDGVRRELLSAPRN